MLNFSYLLLSTVFPIRIQKKHIVKRELLTFLHYNGNRECQAVLLFLLCTNVSNFPTKRKKTIPKKTRGQPISELENASKQKIDQFSSYFTHTHTRVPRTIMIECFLPQRKKEKRRFIISPLPPRAQSKDLINSQSNKRARARTIELRSKMCANEMCKFEVTFIKILKYTQTGQIKTALIRASKQQITHTH